MLGCTGGKERHGINMSIFTEHKVISVCMTVSFFLGIFFRMFLGLLYSHMIKEADNMASTNNRILKQCKVKFSNCYELNNGISNVSVFVDKFLGRMSLGPLSFGMMYHLSGQLILLSVIFSGAGVCRSIMDGHTLGDILPYYIASFGGLYLYFTIATLADIKGKRRMLKINLVDYLENHLSSRIHVTNSDLKMLYGDATYMETTGKRKRSVELMPIHVKETEEKQTGTEQQAKATEEELEALLREFLIV